MESVQTAPQPTSASTAARYVYCILPNAAPATWGPIGLEGAEVYTISYQDICALVHDCPAEPYQGDDETVKGWVWTHGEVIDAAWNATGSVLPLTFDCIIRPAGDHSADATVVAWLAAEYDNFRRELTQFAGKVELGVQVLWRVEAITRAAAAAPAISRLQDEMAGKPKGMAYFYQQKIEKALKAALEAKADADYRRYFETVTAVAEDVSVNKIKRPADGKQMLLNLSLLLMKERVAALGQLLDAIQAEEGVEVRFTGPWPPYSFVAKKPLPTEPA
jgi:hypothetical protein